MVINLVLSFIVGSVFGSFYNVVIYRMPNSLSLITPPSQCPVCHRKLKWYHNVPLLSYAFLRGKCAYCGSKIPVRYFLVELLSGVAFCLLLLKDNFGLQYIFDVSIFSIMLIQSFIDFEYLEVPAVLNDILMILGVIYLINNYSFDAVIFSIIVVATFLIIYAFFKNKLGFGDVKIFIALSMFFKYDLIYIILISSLIGIFSGTILSYIKKTNFSSMKLPFIPFIFIGVILYWIILSILQISTLMNLKI